MHNILVTGAKGQLGSEIRAISENYSFQFFFTDQEELDITKKENIESFIQDNKIQTIINCAAYTAVDKAESDQEIAFKVNRDAVGYLASAIQSVEGNMIHISTDYVFDGTGYKPYMPGDSANPKNIYGKSKWEGEELMRSIPLYNSLIIRTSWVYSEFGSNFVRTMLRLGKERETLNVIDDQIGSPTYAADLAKVLLDIIPILDHSGTRTYHYSNEGVCSWYDFAIEIMEKAGLSCEIIPIPTSQYPTTASRPHYSVMEKGGFKSDYQLAIPYWKNSLQACLNKLTK
ncbi:dTDP-4-dehydrorhamnose reductase [Algoriphagus iocasae]|uniref:dTDP-4-dehydrorhamnose reductase n=1 Tax=Algoriphagus iocasae TaxID=1836499 RepID=A0A841MM24_9BACT|nr:dTDP-4-dehydrorhamnose reductase [Algoriphagus iocasae]MBB6327943.1 dTDP-4-dehydrorhamnose reductase [Algoriphagus iocasae]